MSTAETPEIAEASGRGAVEVPVPAIAGLAPLIATNTVTSTVNILRVPPMGRTLLNLADRCTCRPFGLRHVAVSLLCFGHCVGSVNEQRVSAQPTGLTTPTGVTAQVGLAASR